jgi:molybdopterin-biosynthesis enzyme MoeA-like protein
MKNFYSVIIGTELLNGRREDRHFPVVNTALLKRGWEHKGNFVISDDPAFMEDIFRLIRKDENSVMFCFGGIGATPDDYTRQVAAEVFTHGELEIHPEGRRILEEKFKDQLTERRLQLVNFPKGAGLLTNVVNRVPGFYVDARFFFVPGFPQMAHPMIMEALERFYPKGREKFRQSILIGTSEGHLLGLMDRIPPSLEFSSLPSIHDNKREVEISFASHIRDEVEEWIGHFEAEAKAKGYPYEKLEMNRGDAL